MYLSTCQQYCRVKLEEIFLQLPQKCQSLKLPKCPGLLLQKPQGWDDLIAWPASSFSSRLSPGLCKGSYRSAAQNLHLKRNPSAMSAWTKYSVRFTRLWSWPPPGYFWPQGQLKQCGLWNVICELKPNVDLFRARERQCFCPRQDPMLCGDQYPGCWPESWASFSILCHEGVWGGS